MSERMRMTWVICAIAIIGLVAFMGLRALAATNTETIREAGLVLPAQSTGEAPQSDVRSPADPTPTHTSGPTSGPEPTPDPALPAPTVAPQVATPHPVAPTGPQRVVPDDDDDDDHDDDDDADDD